MSFFGMIKPHLRHEGDARIVAIFLVLVLLGAASGQTRLPGAALAGTWAGAYSSGGVSTAILVELSIKDNHLIGTVARIGVEADLSIENLRATDTELSGSFRDHWDEIALHGQRQGSRIVGTVRMGLHRGKIELVRLGVADEKALQRWEGVYQDGERTFLVERSGRGHRWLTLVELPSGMIRFLFPVAANRFVSGPYMAAAQPEQARFKFSCQIAAGPCDLTINRHGRDVIARQVLLQREEVEFRNGDVVSSGTLVLPNTPGRHAAVVFTHGSGPTLRESRYGLGYLLAANGIASLKYDKRGSGKSGGNLDQSTLVDLGKDAAAGALLLLHDPRIDPQRIGFWGLSQGSSIGPIAASEFGDAAFVIAASGGGLSIDQWELVEGEEQLRTDGRFSETDIADALAFERARDRYLGTRLGWEDYWSLRKKAATKTWFEYPTAEFHGPADPDDPFWQSESLLYFFDATPYLRMIRSPFLGLYGEFDQASSGDGNIHAVSSALQAAGNRDVTLRVLPKANHGLLETRSANVRDWPRAKRVAPEFYPLILDWLKARNFTHPKQPAL